MPVVPMRRLVPEGDGGCAIVTGVSRGIGRAIALRLARDGLAIAGCGRDGEALAKVAAELDVEGGRAYVARCDVTDGEAVETFIDTAESRLGPACTLVNCAGITRDNLLALMPPGDWRAVVDTNLTGTWAFCRAMSYRLSKRRSGSIVNISSIAGIRGNRGQGNYAASKAGIIGLSKSLAQELAPLGIRVNVVAPGYIETDMISTLTAKLRDDALRTIPLRRFGTVEEVAEAVAYLVSDRASYITGQVMCVDGGVCT